MISLSIPFYNTSRYFRDAISASVDNDFVSEIVVTDDGSTDEEWDNINNIINDSGSDKFKL